MVPSSETQPIEWYSRDRNMILKYLSSPGLRNHSYATLTDQQGYSAGSLSIRLSGTGRGVGENGREDGERLLLLLLLRSFPLGRLILRLHCWCIGQPSFLLPKTETQSRSQVFRSGNKLDWDNEMKVLIKQSSLKLTTMQGASCWNNIVIYDNGR